jgi:UDP-GlcNAc:undecaprenyl-phosphate GlcNAc-1-phosphate transferase
VTAAATAAALAAAATAAASAALTAWAVRAAPRAGFVAHPDEVNTHARPTPLLGGAAIFAAAAPGAAFVALRDPEWRGLAAALALALLLGLHKDRGRPVPEAVQLLVQAAAVLCLWAGGLRLDTGGSPAAELAATLAFGVAVLNAVNFLDVQDALAGSVAAVSLAGFAALAAARGDGAEAAFALLLAAGVAGFLVHNRPPARIFMGDAGSFGLGISLAALAFSAAGHPGHGPRLAALVLLVPLGELAATVGLRVWAGRSPFRGDGTHASTALRGRGWPAARVLGVACALALAGAAGALGLAGRAKLGEEAAERPQGARHDGVAPEAPLGQPPPRGAHAGALRGIP